ncbi:MAG: aminopeptidase P family protein [Planctomycetes bacterium]|nr:aminopeptidase P family protein [Planctomycetota bacterium]
MNGAPLLDPVLCRGRQGRLLARLADREVDLVAITAAEHVEYLTGHRWDHRFTPVAALAPDGRCLLVCPDKPATDPAADDVRTYEAKWRSTLRNDQRQASAAVLQDWLTGRRVRRVGLEFSACPPHVGRLFAGAELVDVEPDLLAMRRCKDADELVLLRRAMAASGRMYEAARGMLAPGVTELDVYSTLQTAAVASCGEMLTGTGNDYACGIRGGPPRVRGCEAGDLYILDLGPAFRGYFADTARTIAVDRRPSDVQFAAWERVRDALGLVEGMARPGVRCRDIYEAAREWLNGSSVGSWSSHLGHGIGLFPHEAPHLNPAWNDVLEEGEVIAVEPALYAPELRCGLRLENDYLVTATGLELLSPFPLELA